MNYADILSPLVQQFGSIIESSIEDSETDREDCRAPAFELELDGMSGVVNSSMILVFRKDEVDCSLFSVNPTSQLMYSISITMYDNRTKGYIGGTKR